MSSANHVAIIGLSCRFPGGVRSLDDYWRVLTSGKDVITQIPPERWSMDRYLHPLRSAPGKSCTMAAGVLEEAQYFDHNFFGISHAEARYMDPQQRIMLELAWEMFEDAQLPPSLLRDTNTSVHVGVSSMEASTSLSDDPWLMAPYSMIGNSLSIIANRISYYFNLHGPSMIIDTACSSSLVALSEACEFLAEQGADYAIAGGINVLACPFSYVGFSKAHMLSENGLCKVFDHRGDGYVRAEGGSLVLLKPLDKALRDGNAIHAVIRRTDVNSDGRTVALPYPSQDAQMALLRKVYDSEGVGPDDVDYVEAHGTGTVAGDPVECAAIGTVLGVPRTSGRPLPIGSAKNVIGHLEPASGFAGLLKALLVLREKAVPPNIHYEKPPETIDIEALNLDIVTSLTPLRSSGKPLIVGVNSFGFGGTNAHVLLQEAPAPKQAPKGKRTAAKSAIPACPPIFVSARSEASLKNLAKRYAERITAEQAEVYPHLAAGAAFGRDHLAHRLVASGETPDDVAHTLQRFANGEKPGQLELTSGQAQHERPATAFAFSGNGSQWPGMARELFAASKVFAGAVRKTDAIMKPVLGWSVADALQQDPEELDLTPTEVAQPLIFAIQVGLVEALKAKGVVADMVFGHSVGEIAAAYACGALSLEQASLVMCHRSMLQSRSRGKGRMAAVRLTRDEVAELPPVQQGRLELGAVNSPSYVTLTGDEDALLELRDAFAKTRVVFQMLDLDYPFHSRHMEAIEKELREKLSFLTPGKASLTFISALAGEVVDGEQLNAEYWWHNIRQPVDFHAACTTAISLGARCILEIGPHNVLGHFVTDSAKALNEKVSCLPTLRKDKDSSEDLERAWRRAYVQGWPLDFATVFPFSPRRCELPAYAWEQGDVTLENTSKCLNLIHQAPEHPLLGFRKDGELQVWENTLDTAVFPFLKDHIVFGENIAPGAMFLETALAASNIIHDREVQEITQVAFLHPLPLAMTPATDVRLVVSPDDGSFRIESRRVLSHDPWSLHAVGRIPTTTYPSRQKPRKFVRQPESFGDAVDVDELYAEARGVGLEFGECFRPVRRAWITDDEVLVELELPAKASKDGMLLHPCLIDGGFHALLAMPQQSKDGERMDGAYVPVWIDRMRLYRAGEAKYVLARKSKRTPRSIIASFELLDVEGVPLARLDDCRFNKIQSKKYSQDAKQRIFGVKAAPRKHPLNVTRTTFPATSQLVQEMAPEVSRMVDQLNRQAYYEELRPLCRVSILSHSYSMLASFLHPGQPFTVEELIGRAKIKPEFAPYISNILHSMEEMDLASSEDGIWQLAQNNELPPAEEIWKTIVADYPAYLPEALVLGRLGLHSMRILQGRTNFDEVISQESGAGIQVFNANSPTARFQTALVIQAIRLLYKQLAPGRQMRILELGAGMGGLLNNVLPSLPEDRFEYIAAEKDENALEYLQLSFPDFKGLSFEHLDIETADLDQLPYKGKIDLILASHFMHEPQDVPKVLSRCKDLLSPGGMLLFIERRPDLLIDFFLGLQPGWWSYTTDPQEPVSRLITRQEWGDALHKVGFSDVSVLSEPVSELSEHYIMLARKDDTEQPGLRPTQESGDLWVLLEDAKPTPPAAALGDGLASSLEAGGQEVVRVRAADPGAATQQAPAAPTVDPFDDQSWMQLLAGLATEGRTLKLVHLQGFDTDQNPELEEFRRLQSLRTVSAASLAKAWGEVRPEVQLFLVCGGAMELPREECRLTTSQGALWGMGRVMINEFPGMNIRLVDLHCDTPSQAMLDSLTLELQHPTAEPEIMLGQKTRYCTRFYPLDRVQMNDTEPPERISRIALNFDSQGQLERLYWSQMPDRYPKAGEVEIRTKAVGLNFRDVMYTLGLLPEEGLEDGLAGPTIGLECSGEVIDVGEGVEHLRIGDEVVCMAGGCFDSHVIAKAEHVFPKPENLSHEEAATITVTFYTAYYALKHLADMQPGESVLIHGAAGGVGLAAIQVAKYLGLEIFGTAGSEEKRDFLRLLGVNHVLDSRSLSFVDEIKRITGGKGVDAVLNSLAGEALFKSLELLKPMGRFLELGKRDFYANTPMRMRALRQNITFFGIDTDQLMIYRPKLGRELFLEMVDLFNQGVFKPLVHTVYPRSSAVEAFKSMQKASHIGKLVVTFDDTRFGVRKLPRFNPRGKLDPDASYLVTGGLDGLGFETAKHLCLNGCRHIILLSRSGAKGEKRQRSMQMLENMGVKVTVLAVDVADAEKMPAMLAKTLETAPPLKGVVHSAVVIDDGVIANLTPERIEKVLHAKAVGAWNLHRTVGHLPLDFFIMYTSATTMLGNPGQANYVAANAMLESLAAYRRSQGQPALAAGWGAITDVGWLSQHSDVLNSLKTILGISDLSSKQVMNFLDLRPEEHGSRVFLFNLNWNKVQQLPFASTPVFNNIDELGKRRTDSEGSGDLVKMIRELPREEAIDTLAESIGSEIGAMLKLPASKTGPEATVLDLGMDSLMVVELALMIEEMYGVNVGGLSLGQRTTIKTLAERIYTLLANEEPGETVQEIVYDELTERHGIELSKDKVGELLEKSSVSID